MDSERFDQVTRALASGQSRRSLLNGLTGTAVAGPVATLRHGALGLVVDGPPVGQGARCIRLRAPGGVPSWPTRPGSGGPL